MRVSKHSILAFFSGAAALFGICSIVACATAGGTVVRAEEYYSIANAYFELKKYDEAERWFSLASRHEKTALAARYQLGRIAFEKGEPAEAARIFEDLLPLDPDNLMLIRAAAYSRMKLGEWDAAISLFDKASHLAPETEDARYNYALALAYADRFEEAAERLKPRVEAFPDDRESILLLARMERKLERPEAADHFAVALALKDDVAVRVEFAECLESLDFFARAVEEYDTLLDSETLAPAKKAEYRFLKARALLFAGDGAAGVSELREAITDGFTDRAALELLLADPRLADKAPIEEILSGIAED